MQNTHLLIPRLTYGALSSVNDNLVRVCLDTQTLDLSRAQSVVWGLCQEGTSTIDQLAYQYATLHLELSMEAARAQVLSALTLFAENGLLHFAQLEPLEYPRNITEYSHLFTTRGGLYAVNKQGYVRLAYGMFFGITVDSQGSLLVSDFPHKTSPLWRHSFSLAKRSDLKTGVIRAFRLAEGCVHAPTDFYAPVANSTHHLIWRNGVLFGVDTEGQAVFQISDKAQGQRTEFRETPVLPGAYHHINSLAPVEDGWLLMQCFGSQDDERSLVAHLDADFTLRATLAIDGRRAHDLESVEANNTGVSFWYCDSAGNHIRRFPSGEAIQIDKVANELIAVRGLSQSEEDWVVGSGAHGRYYSFVEWARPLARIHFINKHSPWRRTVLDVPELPCCIISNPAYTGD